MSPRSALIKMNRHCRQGGAGLIEVVISLLVLSVGTLGLTKLQIAAKRVGFEAMQRSEAAALAMDLLERMRANPGELAAYQSQGLGAASGSPLPVPGTDCSLANCTPAELNEWDMWQWEQALNGAATSVPLLGSAGGLVNPAACVTVAGRSVTVEVVWRGGYRDMSGPASPGDCDAGNDGPDDAARQRLQMTSWIAGDWSG